jgi:plasmid stabilization system protein ParE
LNGVKLPNGDVHVRGRAAADIDQAIDDHLSQANTDVAVRSVGAVERAVARIGRSPRSGSLRFSHELDIPGLRVRPPARFPHLVAAVGGPAGSVAVDVHCSVAHRGDLPPLAKMRAVLLYGCCSSQRMIALERGVKMTITKRLDRSVEKSHSGPWVGDGRVRRRDGGTQDVGTRRPRRFPDWIPVGVLVFGLVSGCSSSPSEPPPAGAALEPSLLTVDDVGGEFEVEGRDRFGASSDVVLSFCPDSNFEFQEVGGVDVRFVWPTDDSDPMKLFETLRVVESDRIDTLMTDLGAAVASCDGVEWTDYGDTYSWTPMDPPEIGDRRVAVRSPGVEPSDGRFDLNRRVWIADGDVLVEIITFETLDGAADVPLLRDEELFRIATSAVDKLPE